MLPFSPVATYREFNRDLVSLLSCIPCCPSDNVSCATVTSVIKKKKKNSFYVFSLRSGNYWSGIKRARIMKIKNLSDSLVLFFRYYIEDFQLSKNLKSNFFFLREWDKSREWKNFVCLIFWSKIDECIWEFKDVILESKMKNFCSRLYFYKRLILIDNEKPLDFRFILKNRLLNFLIFFPIFNNWLFLLPRIHGARMELNRISRFVIPLLNL